MEDSIHRRTCLSETAGGSVCHTVMFFCSLHYLCDAQGKVEGLLQWTSFAQFVVYFLFLLVWSTSPLTFTLGRLVDNMYSNNLGHHVM